LFQREDKRRGFAGRIALARTGERELLELLADRREGRRACVDAAGAHGFADRSKEPAGLIAQLLARQQLAAHSASRRLRIQPLLKHGFLVGLQNFLERLC
jgi:hypothetical protein